MTPQIQAMRAERRAALKPDRTLPSGEWTAYSPVEVS
jgi:hypothetical protein